VTVYTQGFESRSLFADGRQGAQTFSDGTEFIDSGGESVLRYGSGRSGSALALFPGGSFGPQSIQLALVSMARAGEHPRVSFWAFNPFGSSVALSIQRAGGSATSHVVSAGSWTRVTAEITSGLSTGRVLVQLGSLPRSTTQAFLIDDLQLESCP